MLQEESIANIHSSLTKLSPITDAFNTNNQNFANNFTQNSILISRSHSPSSKKYSCLKIYYWNKSFLIFPKRTKKLVVIDFLITNISYFFLSYDKKIKAEDAAWKNKWIKFSIFFTQAAWNHNSAFESFSSDDD